MVESMTFRAFLDEAGDRSHSARASDHFVMSAAVIRDEDLPAVSELLGRLRVDLMRHPTDNLHWRNLKSHSQRLHAAQAIGSWDVLTVSSVVVCKRHLKGSLIQDESAAYLYTLRYLLERLSWFARDRGATVDYTLAHIIRFKLSKLRQYEAALLADAECQIAWDSIAGPGRLDQPSRIEWLQIADLAASATYKAFEPDQYGNTEQRYLQAMMPRLYRRPSGKLTSYGLKMHPWNSDTQSAYPWVADLD